MSANENAANPVYVIFGASGGIGSTLCRRLSARGSRLVLASRELQKVQGLAEELQATAIQLDATRFDEVDALMDKVLEMHQRVDGVANCIGSLLLKPAHATSDSEWQATLSTNLTSAFAILRASARAMTSTGGSIVLLSSAAAKIGLANHEAIAAAKAGIIGLTLSAAATYASRGIRVNCVSPGLVRTPMTSRLTSNELSLKASTAMHSLGRIGEPSDVASALDWLLDSEQSWITGQEIGVDGGLSRVRSR